MASKDERNILSDMLSIGGIGTMVGTGALALGAYTGYRNIKANENIVNPMTGPGRISTTSGALGKNLRSRLDRMSKEVAREILDSDKIKELVTKSSDHRAVLGALASTLDDVGATQSIHPDVLLDFKSQLSKVMEGLFATEGALSNEQSDVIQSIVKQIYDGGEKTVLNDFAGRVDHFRGISSALAAPTQQVRSGRAFSVIDPTALGKRASKRAQEWQRLLGNNFVTEAVAISAPGTERGAKQNYLRVMNRSNNRWVQTIPLELSGSGVVFTGENLQTPYTSDRYYADTRSAMNLLSERPNASFTDFADPQSGVMRGLEDHYLNLARRDAFPKGRYDVRKGRDILTQGLLSDTLPRSMFFDDSPLAAHQLEQLNIKRSTVAFTGANSVDQKTFIKAFSTIPGFDSGVGSDRYYSEPLPNFGVARMGIRKRTGVRGLGIDHFSVIGTGQRGRLSRGNELPITAREMQVMGRNAMFDPTGVRASEWTGVKGLTNQIAMLDFKKNGALGSQLGGTGQVYNSGKFRFTTPQSITVLDPHKMNGMSTALLNDIIASSNNNQWLHVSAQDIREKYKGLIGFTDEGERALTMPLDTESMRFRVHTTSTYRGKHELHLSAEMTRNARNVKLFGVGHKGLVINKSWQELMGIVQSVSGEGGVTPSFLAGLGAREGNLLVGAADTAMKAPAYLAGLMHNSVGLMSGGDVNAAVAANSKHWAADQNLLKRYLISSVRELSKKKGPQTPEYIGRTLAGMWSMAEVDPKGQYSGGMQNFVAGSEVSRGEILEVLTGHGYNSSEIAKITRFMDSGQMVTSSGFALGAGPGDLNFGRGSFEPRSAQYLMNRLKTMGLADSDVATVLTDVIGRKIGFKPAMHGAIEVAKMAQGAVGPETVAAAIDSSAVPRLTYGEVEKMGGHAAVAKSDLYKKGYYLELGQETGVRGDQIRAASRQAFGGSTALYIPGAEGQANFRGTSVKTMGKTIEVGSEVSSMVGELYDNLSLGRTNKAGDVTEELTEKLGVYRERVSSLFADTLYNITGGKIKGLRSGHGSQLNLSDTSTQFSGAVKQRYRDLYKATHGTAIFGDAPQFMGQLHDFMGNSEHGAEKLERFFMSEFSSVDDIMASKGAAKTGGIFGFTIRHPQVGSGNIAMSQAFRVLGDTHDPFQEIVKSDWGRKLLGKSGISSFRELHASGDSELISNVFKGMATNLSSFMGTNAAAGEWHIPVWKMKVGGIGIDLGFAGGATGDFDSDIYMFSPFSDKASKTIGKSRAIGKANANFDFRYQYSLNTYVDAAKSGLEDLRKSAGDVTLDEAIRQNALKEYGTKAATGPLDIQLNQMRMAILENVDANPHMVLQTDALLAALQEHTTIKGKKLPLYRDFAGMFGSALQDMFEGRSESLESFFKNIVFRSSEDLWTGRTVTTESLLNNGVPKQIVGGMDDIHFDLGAMIKFMQQSADRARANGKQAFEMSAGRIRAALSPRHEGGAADAMREYLYMRNTSQGAVMAELLGKSFDSATTQAEGRMGRMLHAADIADRRFLGPLALGAAAMAGITSVMSGGYSNDPIMAPGEYASPSVESAISGNQLFGRPDPQVAPRQADLSGDFPSVDSPINTGTTYLNRPSSYSIRGELGSTHGIPNIRNYMSGYPGINTGQIKINDQRRAITQNYMDRLSGEY